MADIAALQFMYGADYTTNSSDTVYKWNPNSGDTLVNGEVGIDAVGDKIFITIWDGGRADHYTGCEAVSATISFVSISACFDTIYMDLSRFDAAPLIAFTAVQETDYGTETDGRIPARCGTYRADKWINA